MAESPGVETLSGVALAYIRRAQDLWWNSTHPNCTESEAIRKDKVTSYLALQSLIQTVLGDTLDFDNDFNPTLFGKPIFKASLSDGQRALLLWCIALHAQGGKLNELILVMDEPETHLHPEAMISMIERIIDANPNGQLWIATHSAPLIASLYSNWSDDLSLYFMSKGTISFASEQPEVVLTSLMGGQKNIAAMREFIDLPEVFATNRFASQCLESPTVVELAHDSDPQMGIVSADIASASVPLKLLDYGCGKGRLLSALIAEHGDQLTQKLDYVGWDIRESNKQACQKVIDKAYDNRSLVRWFKDRQELVNSHPACQFDRVVLCNVLHEITPIGWVELFNETGVIRQCLKQDGFLLIIEDYLMPKGEYAHPFGFIVLDTEPLQELFSSTCPMEIRVKDKREGRIKGHFVPKPLLSNVTKESVRNALQFVKRQAKEKISELRRQTNSDFKTGRAHGFWIQQYTNSTMALDDPI